MAYDLILKRQTSRNFARGPSSASDPLDVGSTALTLLVGQALGLAMAVGAASSPKVRRTIERQYYRRAYRDNLKATQEVPAISMREMVYGEDEA